MKRKYFFIKIILLALLMFRISGITGQTIHQATSFELDTAINGNVAYEASNYIKLKPGFSYKAMAGSSANFSIKKHLIVFTYKPNICAGTNDTLKVNNGNHFVWSTGDTTAFTIVTPMTTTKYYITVTFADGITKNDSVTVNVNAMPFAFAGNDTIICLNDSARIGSTAISEYTYKWNTLIGLNDSTIAQPWAKPKASLDYDLTVTNENGCRAKDYIFLYLIQSPRVEISIISLANSCDGNYEAILSASQGNLYLWNTNETTQSIKITELGDYSVIVTDTYGCSSSSEIIKVLK
jgi:hypothetical protein